MYVIQLAVCGGNHSFSNRKSSRVRHFTEKFRFWFDTNYNNSQKTKLMFVEFCSIRKFSAAENFLLN